MLRSKLSSALLISLPIFLTSLNHRSALAESSTYNDVTRGSVGSGSTVGNGISSASSLSGDGRYLAFQSSSTNLVSAVDSNDADDIFLRDRQTPATTIRISQTINGTIGNEASSSPSISKNGNVVAFQSIATNLASSTDSNKASDIFVKNLSDGALTLESVTANSVLGNGASTNPSISGDGTYLAFQSEATNLVALADSNNASDVFFRNRQNGEISRISTNSGGVQGSGASTNPQITSDGAFVVFESASTNLVGDSDSNKGNDVFLYDRIGSSLSRVSNNSNGTIGNAASSNPSISDDGRYIVFQSLATNLVTASDTNKVSDIFLHDRSDKSTIRISQTPDGTLANGASKNPQISGDGTQIIFLSNATNLISGDSNNTAGDGKFDVFVYKLSDGKIHRINESFERKEQEGTSTSVAINYTGTVFSFDSDSTLVSSANSESQVYVVDENCSVDRDSDSTVNCNDQCPDDANKSSAGSCGCGNLETDTDSDGTPDCLDICSSDAQKTQAGSCGCGTADSDTNGNTIADCLDPNVSSVPQAAHLSRLKKSIRIEIPSEFSKVTYQITVKKSGKRIARIQSRKNVVTVALKGAGLYTVNYTASVASVTSKNSRSSSLRVK